jgi:GTP cyclohydrolase IB
VLHDTQNQRDARGLAIDRVGVKNLRFPLRIRDRDHAEQGTVATVSLAVDLPHHYKGTHMSRFIEVLHSHGHVLTVADIAGMPRELMKRLNAEKAHAQFKFPYFRAKKAPVTGAEGLMDYGVIFEVNAEGAEIDFVVTVEVPEGPTTSGASSLSPFGFVSPSGWRI